MFLYSTGLLCFGGKSQKVKHEGRWGAKNKAEKVPALSKNVGVDLWSLFPRVEAVLFMHISSKPQCLDSVSSQWPVIDSN